MDQTTTGKGNIGAVIWGLRSNGFNNNLISHPSHGIDDVLGALHDERQLCFTQTRPFLSIEQSAGHNLLTIFKVDALDNAKNRAFIGITVFVPRHYRLKARSGSIPEAMLQLLRYYEQVQGGVVTRNVISAGELSQQVLSLFREEHVRQPSDTIPDVRTYAVCPTAEDESKILEGSAWFHARQVLLFKQQPDVITAGLTGYERFDPTPRKEVNRTNQNGTGQGAYTRARVGQGGLVPTWVLATVVGLALLVMGVGAWLVLDQDQLPVPTTNAPKVEETVHSHAYSTENAQYDSMASNTQDSTTEQSGKQVVEETVATGADENAQKQGEKKDSYKDLSKECKSWCQRENEKLNMTSEEKEDHESKGQELNCRCKKK